MKIRKATKLDLDKIVEIFRIESAKKPYVQKWTQKTALEKIKTSLKENDVYVIIINKNVVGFTICKVDIKKKEVYGDELWLSSDYQRRGLGKSLMKFLENIYKKKGIKTFTLIANQKAGAVQFYKKLNYKEKHRFIYFTKKLK